jgi:hypothetical protein
MVWDRALLSLLTVDKRNDVTVTAQQRFRATVICVYLCRI